MKIIKSNIFHKYPELIFGFSTKIGLNRPAPYYFNMSKSVLDDDETVEKNRSAFFEELGLVNKKIAFQKQIHSDIVTKVDADYNMTESDALYTDLPDVALVISSADCVPVFIYDPVNRIIAGVHSGWKGTQQKILLKTINKLILQGSKTEDLVVYIAPCISSDNYEVGPDVAEKFDSKFIRSVNSKKYLDLKKNNYDILMESGIPAENIEVSELCSFEEKELLHSYRRDGKFSGRAAGVICIRGENIVK